MDLGAFSISLAVKDLAESRVFYEKLGFAAVGGDEESWLIVVNGTTVIGLFQGMFDSNILTFNPGWEGVGEEADDFTDIRQLRAAMESAEVTVEADTTSEGEAGPASFVVVDPDGNSILIDQHR